MVILLREAIAFKDAAFLLIRTKVEGEFKRGEASLSNPPPHAKNTSPYHGEGNTGGEVDKNSDCLQSVSMLELL